MNPRKMYSITREFRFEYAHRLNMEYESPCKNIHGHSARVIMNIESEKLDRNGMIFDFSKLKPIQQKIEDLYDHSLILNQSDKLAQIFTASCPQMKIQFTEIDPTSEVLARIIAEMISYELDEMMINWSKVMVTFYETEKNCASFYLLR